MLKLRNETKVGILAIFALAAAFWGYKFLKGVNILTSSQTFYVRYQNVDQLRPSAPIFISGLQVGMVKDIYVDKEDDKSLIVVLNLDKGVQIPKDATASIIGLTLMGGKAVQINIPHPCEGDGCAKSGDFLNGDTQSLARSLLGDPAELDIYVQKLRMAFDTIANPDDPNGLGPTVKALESSLMSIASITHKLDRFLDASTSNISATASNAAAITQNLQKSNKDISDAIANLSAVSAQLKNAGLDATAKSATTALDSVIVAMNALKGTLNSTQATISKVDSIAGHLSSGQGSLGKLLTDDELYFNLSRTTRHLALLEQDIRLNPKRYTTVKLKVFGKNKTGNYVSPIDDPAYQLVLDSLEKDYVKKMMHKQ